MPNLTLVKCGLNCPCKRRGQRDPWAASSCRQGGMIATWPRCLPWLEERLPCVCYIRPRVRHEGTNFELRLVDTKMEFAARKCSSFQWLLNVKPRVERSSCSRGLTLGLLLRLLFRDFLKWSSPDRCRFDLPCWPALLQTSSPVEEFWEAFRSNAREFSRSLPWAITGGSFVTVTQQKD
jgi:hypothetical protein